jgi:hypothetical protein
MIKRAGNQDQPRIVGELGGIGALGGLGGGLGILGGLGGGILGAAGAAQQEIANRQNLESFLKNRLYINGNIARNLANELYNRGARIDGNTLSFNQKDDRDRLNIVTSILQAAYRSYDYRKNPAAHPLYTLRLLRIHADNDTSKAIGTWLPHPGWWGEMAQLLSSGLQPSAAYWLTWRQHLQQEWMNALSDYRQQWQKAQADFRRGLITPLELQQRAMSIRNDMMEWWKQRQKLVQNSFPFIDTLAGPKVRFNPFPRQLIGKIIRAA